MRPVNQRIQEEAQYYDEEFPFIVDDLLALSNDRPTFAEGAALMPHPLAGIGIPLERSIWLVPSPGFQRERYAQRAWRHRIVASCSDREQAWRN